MGVDHAMTIIAIDGADVGRVIAGPGTLSKIEVVTLPARGNDLALGPFTLADNSGPNPRQLFNMSSDNVGRIVGRSLWRNRGAHGGSGFAEILSQYPISFQSLLIASVPTGASFELEVQ
jgi:hypothetical protein